MNMVGLQDAPLARLVVAAGHMLYQRRTRHLADQHGLSMAGMITLLALHKHGELPHRTVAEHCFVRPATLTGVVDTLERDGLVQRRRDNADRRTVRLALTPEGRARAAVIADEATTDQPLTSVDADPAKAAVIREYLLELIEMLHDGEDGRVSTKHRRTCRDQHHNHPKDEPC